MMSDDDGDDVHAEFSDDDIDSIEEEALKRLESKQVVVENADGTLRCPYSPSRKKQSYPYKDLLQHAEGVAKGKRGAEAAGQHSALVKYLKSCLSGKASAPVERVHKLELTVPQRNEGKDLLVCPWTGVIYNFDNSKRDAEGKKVGPGNAEIKQYFAPFNPEKAHACWDAKGHQGLGVVIFRRDLEGLKDAQAFETWFIERGHGRREWELGYQQHDLGNQLYGWLARKEDYDGRKEIPDDWAISKYLKQLGDLTDVAKLGQEMNKMHEQRVQNLKETVDAKNEEYEVLLHEKEVVRRRAEAEKLRKDEEHKKELEKVKRAARESELEHARVMQEQNQQLQRSLALLNRKCRELDVKEHQNQVDKTRLEQEKKENLHHLDIINQQSARQRKHQAEQVKLIKKHEEESKKLAKLIQSATLRLAAQQQAEIENQQLGEMMDAKKFAELAETFEPSGLVNGKNVKELEDRIKEMEKTCADKQAEVDSLNEDMEGSMWTLQTLTVKERAANDELEEARKASLKAVNKYGNKQGIHVKKMGDISDVPWKRECQKRYKKAKDGWELTCRTMLSQWEEKVKDPDFHAFKTVQVGKEDKWERKIDENNKDLLALKEELGEEVMQTVVTALEEIEEYNPSGRYPITITWNFQENKRATLSEIIRVLIEAAENNGKKKPVVKKRRLVEG